MTQQYLLPCTCGKKLTVTASQAGHQVVCTCGATMEVPPFSRLRSLEGVTEETRSRQRLSWGLKQSVMLFGLFISLLSLASAYYMYLEEVKPFHDDQMKHKLRSTSQINAMSPKELWEFWQISKTNFIPFAEARNEMVGSQLRGEMWVKIWLWVAAAGGGVVLIGPFLPGNWREKL